MRFDCLFHPKPVLRYPAIGYRSIHGQYRRSTSCIKLRRCSCDMFPLLCATKQIKESRSQTLFSARAPSTLATRVFHFQRWFLLGLEHVCTYSLRPKKHNSSSESGHTSKLCFFLNGGSNFYYGNVSFFVGPKVEGDAGRGDGGAWVCQDCVMEYACGVKTLKCELSC